MWGRGRSGGPSLTLAEVCSDVLTGLRGTVHMAQSRVIPRATSAPRRPGSLLLRVPLRAAVGTEVRGVGLASWLSCWGSCC